MRLLFVIVFLPFLAVPVRAQMPPIGRIEISGHASYVARVRSILSDLQGKPVSAEIRGREDAIEALPGVAEASIEAVCCDGGRTTLYVSLRGDGAPTPNFKAEPSGTIRLPPSIVSLGERFERALEDAVSSGAAGEDHSAGHAMMEDPAARRVQEEFIVVAGAQDSLLREVIVSSSDPNHRALAAQMLAYAPDKRAIVGDLLAAAHDGNPIVRNVAVRSLWILAGHAAEHPDAGVVIPAEPFIDLLESVAWTDRNKSSLVLMQLTAGRDSALLDTLRARAFGPLLDMARWSNPGHAFPGVILLGRMAGIGEEAIVAALTDGRKESIIDAALRALGRTDP